MSKELINVNNKIVINDQEIEILAGDVLVHDDDVFPVISTRFDKEHGLYIKVNDNGRERDIHEDTVKKYYQVLKDFSFDKIETISSKIMSGELSVSDLEDDEKQEAGLMVVNTNFYLDKREELRKKELKVKAIQGLIRYKTDIIRRNINSIISYYDKAIKKLNKIIFTLELYAGIEESIKQIQSGVKADDSEPIHLMQLMKFMDEEVGDPSNGGISYDTIEKFDEWLLSFNKHLGYYNYELLIPYKKGVRIMRVRRKVSEKYSSDIFKNRWSIDQEMSTYVIIRNGDNFYTISSKMNFSEKLFPDVKELTDFYNKANKNEEVWHSDEKIEHYKHGMILMQGLLDRTDVFGELYGKVSFLKSNSSEKGDVVFNYEDDDKLITDGSATALDFLNTSTIEAGDRILIYNAKLGYRAERLYKQWFKSEFSYPQSPDDGIYKLEYDKESSCLYFRYIPDETVYTRYSSHKRKKGFSYRIYSNDDNIVNIDIVSHRNIEWIENMLYDRRDRKNYLRAAGLLMNLKKYKREELKQEEPFKNLIISVCKVPELDALDAIHWWKTKNKHKRPLFIDDVKALRMITKYLKDNKQ